MLAFLVLISAFPPLTTDIYLPAMPQMVDYFQTSESKVNLTLSSYFIINAFGLLFWGPLSEKFGRKPILLLGTAIYIIASFFCVFSPSIELLISARILQAFGASAVTVVATAIVKDLYEGRERQRIMATVMSLVIIVPMIAPVLGAFLMQIASWRMVFVVLAGFGILTAVIGCLYQETLPQRYQGSMLRSWGRLFVVLKNPRFSILLAIFSLAPFAMLAFLASGSFIYIDGFAFSEQKFSYFFAFNAMCAFWGPTIYMRLSKRISTQSIISGCFLLMAICGLVVMTVGDSSPYLFAMMIALATITVITMRVPGAHIMLEQQERDTGSAAALIQFFAMLMGALGMFMVSLSPGNLVQSLGAIELVAGLVGGVLWFVVRHRAFVAEHVK